MADLDTLNPSNLENYSLTPVGYILVGSNQDDWYNAYIAEIEFESNDSGADMMRVVFDNPNGIISDAGLLKEGVEINFYLGYVGMEKFVGRGVVVRYRAVRQQDPIVEVICYTRDYFMSKNEPKNTKIPPNKKKIRTSRIWDVNDLSIVIKDIASFYNFKLDVDKASRSLMDGGTSVASMSGGKGSGGKNKETITDKIIQPAGVSDLSVCSIIANEIGYLFWVDSDEEGNWTLHFKNPETTPIQKIGFDFHYNDGENSDILEFDGERILDGASSITVQFTDPTTKELISVEVNALNEKSEQITTSNKPTNFEIVNETESEKEKVLDRNVSPGQVWIEIGETAHKVVTLRSFKSIEDVQAWATKWFKEYNEQFIQQSVVTIGHPELLAFHVTTLHGLGGGWDGDQYVYKVKHNYSRDSYTMEFSCRKIPNQSASYDTFIPNPFVRRLVSKIAEILNI